jgi:hypothetical protein
VAKAVFTYDTVKHTFDLNVTGANLAGEIANPFRVLVAAGPAGAGESRDWVEGRGGKFTRKP